MSINPHDRTAGMTLVELMITVAILSVIVAIALPAYNGYIREGHFTTIRATMNGMRTAVEDYRLENGNYGSNDTLAGVAAITARFGWTPSGDTSAYTYTLVVESTNSYDVYGQFGSGAWARCDNRYQTCCDSDTTGSDSPIACP
ncbi:MAG: prepilin-type N-terminal cleavage/methylation domain-containing protein [Chromatiaceae bacterium]|nr:prepilin-type N-terminal cleavage/methylation domain-containing protein [Chromatiaceae bacterium]